MIIDEEKRKEFERAAKPLIRFLHRNYHPHVAAYVDSCSAELLERYLYCVRDSECSANKSVVEKIRMKKNEKRTNNDTRETC
jgi:hypothetical protein